MKYALLVIDMQNGFLNPESPLCIRGARATVPACARLIAGCRSADIPVVFVNRSYRADGSDVEATRHAAWLAGGRPLSPAADDPATCLPPAELAPAPGDRVVVKPRFSAFFGTGLDLVLRRLGVGTVVLAGTTTPNCIRTTCYDALSLDYNVVVVEDCCSSRSPEVQRANMEDMAHIGAHIMDCAAFCEHGLADAPDTSANVRAQCRNAAGAGTMDTGHGAESTHSTAHHTATNASASGAADVAAGPESGAAGDSREADA